MPSFSLRTRVFHRCEDLRALTPAWETLRRRLPASHIQHCPEWLALEVAACQSRHGAPLVATAWDGNALVGVAPFLLQDRSIPCRTGYTAVARFTLRVADLCGESLLAPEDRGIQSALLQAVAETDVPYDLLHLESIPKGSMLWKLAHDTPAVRRHYWTYCPEGITAHRTITMPATGEEYWNRFGKESRRKLNQFIRKLEKNCDGMRLQRVTAPEDTPELLAAVARVYAESWQGKRMGGADWLSDDERVRYRGFAERGWLRAYLLWSGDQPIAFGIGLQNDGVFYYDTIGFDQRWFSFAPGKVLFRLLMDDLFADTPPQRFDWGYGDNHFKRQYGTDAYDDATLLLLRRSLPMARVLATHATCAKASELGAKALERLNLGNRARRYRRGCGSAPADTSAPSPEATTPLPEATPAPPVVTLQSKAPCGAPAFSPSESEPSRELVEAAR